MIKKYSIILSILLLICSLQAKNFSFLHIPIQEQGRIKPLDSFARNQLLKFYGKNELTIYTKNSISYKMPAINSVFQSNGNRQCN